MRGAGGGELHGEHRNQERDRRPDRNLREDARAAEEEAMKNNRARNVKIELLGWFTLFLLLFIYDCKVHGQAVLL
jgi:hypothetical protein